MSKPDKELMVAYQEHGDETALSELFQRYKDHILNFSLRYLNNRADAEDVTSEVFVSLMGKRYTPHPDVKFKTWLFTVARNACLSKIRKQRPMISQWFKKSQSDDYEAWDVPDPKSLPPEEMAERETTLKIKRAIRKLPVEQKEAILLREYHQMAYDQIAVVLNCSLEKVKILIFRAREQLRIELTSTIIEGNHG